jgi:hypothetical protein
VFSVCVGRIFWQKEISTKAATCQFQQHSTFFILCSVLAPFNYLQLTFVFFRRKNIGKTDACKMLVKLTTCLSSFLFFTLPWGCLDRHFLNAKTLGCNGKCSSNFKLIVCGNFACLNISSNVFHFSLFTCFLLYDSPISTRERIRTHVQKFFEIYWDYTFFIKIFKTLICFRICLSSFLRRFGPEKKWKDIFKVDHHFEQDKRARYLNYNYELGIDFISLEDVGREVWIRKVRI